MLAGSHVHHTSASEKSSFAFTDNTHKKLGNHLSLLREDVRLEPKLLHESQEQIDGMRGYSPGLVPDPTLAEKPLDRRRKVLNIVFEVVCVSHDRVKEEIRCEMVIVAQKVLAEQLLDERAVGVVRRVAVSKLSRDALMDLNYGQ